MTKEEQLKTSAATIQQAFEESLFDFEEKLKDTENRLDHRDLIFLASTAALSTLESLVEMWCYSAYGDPVQTHFIQHVLVDKEHGVTAAFQQRVGMITELIFSGKGNPNHYELFGKKVEEGATNDQKTDPQ